MVAARARYLDDGLLFLQEGKLSPCCHGWRGSLSASAEGLCRPEGKLLLPGFVDAHVHHPQTEMIGAFGEQLLEWFHHLTPSRWRASLPMRSMPEEIASFL